MENLKLTINMLPKGAWNNDLSKTLSKKDWDKLREFALKRAKGKCEICGYKTDDLDIHEEWHFNIKNKTQTLKQIIAICSRCHGVKHFKNSVRLGYGEEAQEHFIKTNNCSEIKFASHLNKSFLEYEERNKVYRWKIVADLEQFGGKDIAIKQNNIPLIRNPYESVNWNDYDFIKNNYKNIFFINNKNLYYLEPFVFTISVDNYQGVITVVCDNVNKIEWYLDEKKIKTKYNVVGQFSTDFNVKGLVGNSLKFRLIGTGAETISKKFEIFPLEVL